ncbi:kinase-like protein [Macrolepiota fuliginosa MF-IS2]|uniref:Kinase-like protein n=1 Tax=Macrolepiota fuliginosa MF-IS2 TaxID=1400762 RepID=A0A9P5X776_9AGAR|nr:kinase-like protein [Macrolepiota fuliginosa MF-IS2]
MQSIEDGQNTWTDLTGRVRLEENGTSTRPVFGGYSVDVYAGYFTEDNKTRTKVAIKVLHIDKNQETIERAKTVLYRETAVWQTLNHPNVLRFLGLAPDLGMFGCPALISAFCGSGTVEQYLERSMGHTYIDRLSIIRGVAEGLKYLHERDIVHDDIRPTNVLMHDDGRPLLCFGCVTILEMIWIDKRPINHVRVAGYRAPERLMGHSPHKASDVYAFAFTSYQIWTGKRPVRGYLMETRLRQRPYGTDHSNTEASILDEAVLGSARPEYPHPVPIGTDSIWKILELCWAHDPCRRLDAASVVQNLDDISLPRQRLLSSS